LNRRGRRKPCTRARRSTFSSASARPTNSACLDIDSNSAGCTSTAGGCPACCAGAEKHCERCQDEGKVPGSHATLQPNDAKGYFEPPHRIGGVLRTLRRAAAACPEGPVTSSSSKRNRRYHSNSFDGFRDHQIPFAEQYDRGTRHRRMRGVEDCSASKPRRRV